MYLHLNCSYLWKQPFPLSEINKVCFFFSQSVMFVILSCTVFFFALRLYGSASLPAFVLSSFWHWLLFLKLYPSYGEMHNSCLFLPPHANTGLMWGLSWAGRRWIPVGITCTTYYLMGRYCAWLFLAGGRVCDYVSHHFQRSENTHALQIMQICFGFTLSSLSAVASPVFICLSIFYQSRMRICPMNPII